MSAEDLKKKRSVRGGHRGSAKKMMGQLDAALAETPPDHSKISQLKRSLEVKVDTLKALDSDILNYIDDEGELANEIEQADDYMGVLYAAIIKAEKSVPRDPVTPMSTPGTAPLAEASGVTPPAKTHCVRLPKLSLDPFSGDVTQWLTFWD